MIGSYDHFFRSKILTVSEINLSILFGNKKKCFDTVT